MSPKWLHCSSLHCLLQHYMCIEQNAIIQQLTQLKISVIFLNFLGWLHIMAKVIHPKYYKHLKKGAHQSHLSRQKWAGSSQINSLSHWEGRNPHPLYSLGWSWSCPFNSESSSKFRMFFHKKKWKVKIITRDLNHEFIFYCTDDQLCVPQ